MPCAYKSSGSNNFHTQIAHWYLTFLQVVLLTLNSTASGVKTSVNS